MDDQLELRRSTTDPHQVELTGLILSPLDGGDEPAPYVVTFSAAVLAGVADYLARHHPWDLWVGTEGRFVRDGSECTIEAVRFGWATPYAEDPYVYLVADVRNTNDPNDQTANEPQPLADLRGHDISRFGEQAVDAFTLRDR